MSERLEIADGWHKSSWSTSGECVEIKFASDLVHIRDSKDPEGPSLTFSHPEWLAFTKGVARGEFEAPADSDPTTRS